MSEGISITQAVTDEEHIIPQPHRFPLRIYHREGIDEPTIQGVMGMNENSGHFSDILHLIRRIAKRHADLNLSYNDQRESVLRKIEVQVLACEPTLARYEDAWPITAYLRSFMRAPLRNDTPVPHKGSTMDRSASPASTIRRHYPKTNRMSVVVPSRASTSVTMKSSRALEDTEPVTLAPAQSKAAIDEVWASQQNHSQHEVTCDLSPLSSCSVSPSLDFLSLAFVPEESSPNGEAIMSVPLPAYDRQEHSEIVALLLEYAIPQSDAEHIAGVLASLGIRDKTYLRVLSKLSTWNRWLVELQVTGKLTEIQTTHLEGPAMGDETPHFVPIPAPKIKRPHIIYAAPGRPRSLQEQMGLEDDLTTFAKLMWLIRHVAARHIDLTIQYCRQDPALLAKVKKDIISQSSMLRDEYVDAWPIDSYLRISLKPHVPKGNLSSENGHKKKSQNLLPEEVSHMRPSAHSRRYELTKLRPAMLQDA
ncbi:hypothetical protein NUW54_g7996 [Trametes sanguinea]|uniref:Uncharacterized protein n=1 Tax=Trametes sanguinea TaxID=158606 RepID=A0ACC1PGL8_9APHY|nr:hypothetical protein NUW54_g7996 [Trametes sanguinea]